MTIGARGLDKAVDAAFEPFRRRPEIDRAAALVSNWPTTDSSGSFWPGFKGRAQRARTAAVPSWPWPPPASPLCVVSRVVKRRWIASGPRTTSTFRRGKASSSGFPSGHAPGRVLHGLRPRRFASGDGGDPISFASAVAGKPDPPTGPPPHRCDRRAAIGSVLGLGLRPIVDAGGAGERGRRRGRRAGPRRGRPRKVGTAVKARTNGVRQQGMAVDDVVLHARL